MKSGQVLLLSMLCAAILFGCGSNNEEYVLPMQHWKDADIRVETHPSPPLAGMSEIVVIITGPHGRPIPDISVALLGDVTQPWVQAIQDGMIGVYRRAVDLGDGKEVVLQVKLQHLQEVKILFYNLKLAAG